MNPYYYDSAQPRHRLREEIAGLLRYGDLIWLLIWRNLTVRYKRSLLGALWSLLDPLITMVIMAIVFSQLLASRIPFFPVYLLSALLVYSFFAQATQNALSEFKQAGALLTKVYVPPSSFVVVSVGTALVNLAIGMVLLVLVSLALGATISLMWLTAILGLILGFVFAVGVGLAFSPLSVLYADLDNIYAAVLRIVMYLSAVFYKADMFSGLPRLFIKINPLYQLIELVRVPVYQNSWPSLLSIAYVSVWALVTLIVGWALFLHFIDEAILTL